MILGAGLDSFALRRPELGTMLDIFEIDHPASQRSKRARLAELGLDPPNVTYVSVDFEQESLTDGLARSSFSRDGPAFMSWLGTTYYLTKSAVFATLGDFARSVAPGSEIVFDYFDPFPFGPGRKSNMTKRLLRMTARRGEPMITGFEDNELRRELRQRGLDVIEILAPENQRRRYFSGRADGLDSFEHARFCTARVL